jgi:hypothetical protein
MNFLFPLFLIGLAGLAVPVLLHLIQRERKRVVEFPSLMFLRRIPYRSVRRRRIRHWLLLALRLAALLLVVAAFARPFVRQPAGAAALSSGPRELVVLLDRSYSMGYGDRWDRARAAARNAVESLASGDRGSLVLFSTSAHAEPRSSPDRGQLLAAIDAAKPGSGATRLGPALKVAQSIVAASTMPRREVVLISDFQKIGWRRDDAVRLPDGTAVTPVSVSREDAGHVSVSSVSFQRTSFSGQQRVGVTAAIANRGAEPLSAYDVALEIDGRQVATAQVDLPPRASAAVTFPPFTLNAPNTRGTVRAAPDALPADNVFHFALSPAQPVPVVIAEREGPGDPSLYLSRALAIGDAPRFDVKVGPLEQAAIDRLRGRAVLVLNDTAAGPSNVAAIRRFVEDGGGLLIVSGDRGEWPAAMADLLPALPGDIVDRNAPRAGILATIDFSHPVFEPFRAPHSGDFSSARFFRYRQLGVADASQVVARFDDGTVALAERRVGAGRVMVWTSTFDTYWNDLALKPVFLPFVHGAIRHLSQYVEQAPWLTVGQVLDPASLRPADVIRRSGTAADLRALTPSGAQVRLHAKAPQALELTEQGFYEIRANDDASERAVVAVNLDPVESDLTAIDPKEVVAAISGRAGGGPSEVALAELTPADQERRLSLWWYLLMAALALLAVETVMSNRLSRKNEKERPLEGVSFLN